MSKVPVGAALTADNLVANKDGVAESRRGFGAIGASLALSVGQYIDQYFSYQNRLMINLSTGALAYDSEVTPTVSPVWTPYSGTWTPPSGATKMRGVEANKNFYLTSNTGIYKQAVYSDTPKLSGVPPALDGTGALSGGLSGLLGSNEQAAYQIVFGYTDVNGNLNLGAPSQRILVVNATGSSDDVALTFTVPQGLTTSYFYQIYRTPQTTYSATPSLNIPPGAEPQLATQQQLTGGQISALSVSYTDITPDELLGAALYTNPSQQGALQANDAPPLSVDMCLFSQMMFYANCQTLQNVQFNLISVGSPNGIVANDTIIINSITFTAKSSQNNASKQFKVSSGGTVSENIDDTARALIQCINANAATTNVYALYLSGYNDLPGLILLQAVNFSQGIFYVTSSRGGAFDPVLPSSGTTFGSSNDSTPNGLYVSKVSQPEAVPVVNLYFIGGGDQPIYRVLPLRDRVIVIKSDGVFVVTGSTPQNLSVTLLDSTIICIAPESAKLLNNSVYCMTQQGVVSITESGVTIQSRAIESDLLSLAIPSYTGFTSACHAIGYESERLYILNMPVNPGDTTGQQQFCYNWITNAWTHWTMDISAGLVNPSDNLLYLGRPNTGTLYANYDFCYQERKNYDYADFMDDEFTVTLTSVDATGLILTISQTPAASWVGCGFSQVNVGTAIITAIDAGANTITVDIDDSSTPGDVLLWIVPISTNFTTIQEPISLELIYAPITGGYPHYVKNWGRVNFWFNGGNFQLITAAFISDITGPAEVISAINTGQYGFGPFGGGAYGGTANYPQSIQTIATIGQARWIQPSLSLAFPQTRFSCMGVTLSYDNVSDASG